MIEIKTGFSSSLDRYGDYPAVIVAETGEVLSYASLSDKVKARQALLPSTRSLVFLEASNSLGTLVDYLACLNGEHVLFMVEDLSNGKTQELMGFYQPNLVINKDSDIQTFSAAQLDLHPELALLLSTSGSTGSPKFVKLSMQNLSSNAGAIAEYLGLTQADRAFQHLKPYYSYGLSVINSHLSVGAALILSDRGVMEPDFWQAFNAHQATSFAGVPHTFETLRRLGFKASDYPSLRYATQAGGKLEATLVSEFADQFSSSGREFVVMYGQTEAAPRMSYLPADLATSNPASIGRSIPGGRLYLIDDNGDEIEPVGSTGELVYEGPNVMLGYATCLAELATAERPKRLLTGDVAYQDESGLFFITGRKSRFVKPFGIRVNLDEMQTYIRRRVPLPSLVSGDDRKIVIAFEGAAADASLEMRAIAERFALPAHLFQVRYYDALPRLANDKPDLRRIMEDAEQPVAPPATFVARIFDGIKDILGLQQPKWRSVSEVFANACPHAQINSDTRFSDLGVDSLAYVSIAIEMEALFDADLPANWHEMTLGELEGAYTQACIQRINA